LSSVAAYFGSTIIRFLRCAIVLMIALANRADVHAGDGLEFVTARVAPQGTATQGGMLIVRCIVKNTAISTKEGFLVARFVGDLNSEDRRRIHVDPQQSRIFEFPVRIPPGYSRDKLEVIISIVSSDAGTEAFRAEDDPMVRRPITAAKASPKNIAAAVALGTDPSPGPAWRWETPPIFHAMECALATRVEAGIPNDFIYFENRPLPVSWPDWHGIDTLILGDSRHLQDQATVTALRAFLSQGGRIWVMLDSIDCSLVEGLLASNQSLRLVDTVDLDHLVVDVHGISLADTDRTAVFENAISFKRVVQTGGEVTHAIEGWPAAMVMPVGRGELVLTMLDSQGWIEPRKIRIEPAANNSNYELRPWAKSLADLVHLRRATPILSLSELDYPLKRIGNPVVSREFVTSVLLGFCASLLALGLWRFGKGNVARIGLWIPTLSIAACVPILFAGLIQKKDIADTVSVFQWVQFGTPSGGTVREAGAVYLQSPREMVLNGNGNSFAFLDPKMQSGITTVVHDDFERWRITNTAWPAGVWRYTTDTLLPGNAMVARGEWTPQGLEVHVPPGLPSPLADPILSFVAGSPVLGKSIADNTILIDGAFPAEGERWTLRSMVDDEQARRTEIYKQYFGGSDRLQIPTQILVGWSDLFQGAPTWGRKMENRGGALVTMPLVLQRANVGDEVFVPYPCITIRNAALGESAPLFMEGVGKWIAQSSSAAETNVLFVLPDEVVPLDPKSIQIDWDVEAPRRQVRLSLIHPDGTEPMELVSLDAPSIPWKTTLDAPVVLRAARSGKIVLRIDVSKDRVAGGSLPWRIGHLRLSVRGTVLPKHPWSLPQKNVTAAP
jgi:hypothetical protein